MVQQSIHVRHIQCSPVLLLPRHVAAMALPVTTDIVPRADVAGELTVDEAQTFCELPVRSPCDAAVLLQTAALTAHRSPVPRRAAGPRPTSRPRSPWRSWAQERSRRPRAERFRWLAARPRWHMARWPRCCCSACSWHAMPCCICFVAMLPGVVVGRRGLVDASERCYISLE